MSINNTIIDFATYFNSWLYGNSGYYTNFKEIGKSGDFYTSVSSSKFFGGSIAKRIISSIDEGYLSKDSMILEIGAHKGYLLADIIEFIYTLRPELIKSLKFGIVEKFELLQKIQKEYFIKSFGFKILLHQYNDLAQVTEESVSIVANEIFDAFPTQIIANQKMLYIDNHKLVWGELDNSTKILANKYNIIKGEVSSSYKDFAKELKNIKKFEFISFDYGDRFSRGDISARIYKNSEVFPLFEETVKLDIFYKNSDITYDVNFELLIGEFESEGLQLMDYKTQAAALMDFGFLDLLEILEKNVEYDIYTKVVKQAKVLIDPTFLGERFKMVRFRYSN